MKVLVAGSRAFGSSRARGGARAAEDAKLMRERLAQLPRDTTIIHGGARGADQLAGVIARGLGMAVEVFPVTDEDWRKLGPTAGHRRNARMLDELDPAEDLVLAYWVDRSGGTANTIEGARERGIRLEVYET